MPTIKVRCADCGRVMGTFVRLGKRSELELEVHACFHAKLHTPDQTEPDNVHVGMIDKERARS